jgi:hypothetical protein
VSNSPQQNFDNFINQLGREIGNEIIGIGIIGSGKGIQDPHLSDIDLLLIDKDTTKGHDIFKTVRNLEWQFLGTKHTRLTNLLQRHTLTSNDYHGVHILLIGDNELDENYRPQTLRLKILTSFISLPLFLYKLNKDLKIIYGHNYYKEPEMYSLGWRDRLTAFTFPLLLVPFLLFTIFNRKSFIIWSLKILKYHVETMESYFEMVKLQPTSNLAERINREKSLIKLRYHPESYAGRRITLILRVIVYIFQDSSFLFDARN